MTALTGLAPLAVMGLMGGAARLHQRRQVPWRRRERERIRETRGQA